MHYCIPNQGSLPPAVINNFHEITEKLFSAKGFDPLNDFYKSRWVILASVFVAILYTFIFMKFMDYCALQCAWISVIAVQLGLIAAGGLCWLARNDFLQKGTLHIGDNSEKWLLATAAIFWIVGLMYCLCLTCNLKSLRVSIRIIETAADFFADTKRVALVPIFFFIVAVATVFAFLYGYICISSIGTISVDSVTLQTKRIAHPDHIVAA